ncbi:putative serine/threonine-protein kinase drkA, variant 2 [Balamuthia mandrillaris]
MPFEVKLVPTNGGPTLELPKGSTILGRSPKFGITDRRVSRKHAQVLVSQETSSVTLMSLGVNPSFLQRGASKTVIPKGELKMLENNDVISLLEGEVSFRVLISPDEEEEEEQEPQTEFDQDATQPNMDNYDYLLLQTAEDPAAGGAPLPVSPVKRQREHSSPRPKKGGANKRARIAPKRLALEDSQDSQNSENSSENFSGLKGMEIDPGELKIMNKVGVGSCGEVYEALWKGTRVAVKKIFRTLIHSDSFNEFKAEALILRNLRHPNVVLFMGTCTRRDEMSIITEFMSRGNLRDVLNDESVDLSWELILKIASDAAQGMNYLHTYQPPIIHRDLKSHNLLVDENYNVKVTDFGLAKSMTNDKAMTFCGTMPWTAPEIFSNAGYTTKADVYSYGIVLWELFTREEPYKDMHKPQIIIGVSKDGLRPVIPTACPPQLAELMRDCWKEDPAQRPSFSEILERLRTMQPPPPAFKHTFSTSDLNPLTLTESFKHATTREVALMHTWQIEGSELEFGVEVGQGASSHVFKGKYRGQDVAIKVLKERVDGKHLEEFKKEFAIMSDMRSPRVVFFYGAVTHPHLAIVTEFFSKGSLYDVMCNSNLNFDWRLLLRLSIEAAKSLNALHCWRPQILHRDLKVNLSLWFIVSSSSVHEITR